MSTDIARMDTSAVAVLGGATEALDRLSRWVAAARDAHALVAPLVDTAFVPEAYKPKIDPRATAEQKAEARSVAIANATAAVLQGITLGLDPLTALQQIYIVHGRPGMYSEMKVALLKAHGHEVWTEDLSDTRAVVCGRRAGTEYVERVTVSMAQARTAGWTKNDTYAKTPQDMLYARAAGRVCDRVAPDVLMGIASVEEIRDEIHASAEVGNGQRTIRPPRRAPAIEAAVEEPELVEDQPAIQEPEPEPAPRLITTAQQKMMHALLNQHGKADRDVALVYIAGVIGREIDSTKELSSLEAGAVIDTLTVAEEPTLDEETP